MHWYVVPQDLIATQYTGNIANCCLQDHIVQWHATILAKLALIPQRTINSYSKDSPDVAADGIYHDGDFVIHLNACDAQGRSCEEELQPYYSMWQRKTSSSRSS